MNTFPKMDIIETIKDGVNIGIKNIAPIIVNAILWLLTCWIPYLNVGTTIGLWVGIVSKASRGETISSTEIFDPKYRKFMGEYFITAGLVFIGTLIGLCFLIIPGIVISIAWSLSLLLLIDKGKNPTEAISLSNNCTYGYKWKMFAIYFLTITALAITAYILSLIPFLGEILAFLVNFMTLFIMIGLQASVYKQLTEDIPPLSVEN